MPVKPLTYVKTAYNTDGRAPCQSKKREKRESGLTPFLGDVVLVDLQVTG
jgi:hypothetical protein